LPPQAADWLYADLPFGNLVGSHVENRLLYPAILQEAARLARPNAAFVVLTHEINLMRASLKESPWNAVSETRINLRGLHPRLFVLEQNSARI
jgi:23S rRNA G2445 N2-methylase RlmL